MDFYQVDAFADQAFEGNPAVVYPLGDWLPDALMQSIAAEHNLSETAFLVPEQDGYRIRWFTPVAEVKLCGHATLAAAHVLFREKGHATASIVFQSLSGPLIVRCDTDLITLDFPADFPVACEAPPQLAESLGVAPLEVRRGEDLLVVIDNETTLRTMEPDMRKLAELDCRGICVTAPGNDVDFVSRFFAPRHGIDEDPVTGSAHCALTPYWAERLGKSRLEVRQLSKRGGRLWCKWIDERVEISGRAVTYSHGRTSL